MTEKKPDKVRQPKKGPGLRKVSIRENKHPHKWKAIRWSTLIGINLLFYLSFAIDIQILEGTLSGSRLLGFHLADPFAALQTMLASHVINTNLIIGLSTITLFYLLIGGRAFCSWVCPYHFFAELGESLRSWLKDRDLLPKKQYTFERKIKYILFVLFLALSYLTGYTVFEVINPVSALSRAFVYGPGLTLIFVLFLLAFEVLFSRRAWCRYFCPVGVTYSLIGKLSPIRVHWKPEKCSNCKECQAVCMVPFVLKDTVNKGKTPFVMSGECTRCGLCVDVCDDAALTFKVKDLEKLI